MNSPRTDSLHLPYPYKILTSAYTTLPCLLTLNTTNIPVNHKISRACTHLIFHSSLLTLNTTNIPVNHKISRAVAKMFNSSLYLPYPRYDLLMHIPLLLPFNATIIVRNKMLATCKSLEIKSNCKYLTCSIFIFYEDSLQRQKLNTKTTFS